jgi:hypothetical protein
MTVLGQVEDESMHRDEQVIHDNDAKPGEHSGTGGKKDDEEVAVAQPRLGHCRRLGLGCAAILGFRDLGHAARP